MHNQDRVHSQTPEITSSKIKLSKVFDNEAYGGNNIKIEYEYDVGDCWTHEIRLTGRREVGPFEVLDGEGHGVAEDVGSVDGWENLKKAYRSTNPNDEQQYRMEWYEHSAFNCDPEGLGNGRDRIWDKDAINISLASSPT